MVGTTELLGHFDEEVRRSKAILASNYRVETREAVRRTFGPFPLAAHNWIDWFACEAESAGALIDEQVGEYAGLGHAFRWKVYGHDAPAEMPDLLLAKGFERADTSALMVLDVAGTNLARPEGIEYRRVSEPSALAGELREVRDKVWGDGADELIRALAMELRDVGEYMSIFAAKQDGRTVGCGLARHNENFTFGGLFAGATVPEMRNRGVYRGMVAARVDDARERGTAFLYTEAGPMSEPILDRLGFRKVSTVSNFVKRPAETE